MKKLSLILASFCAALAWHPNSQAAEVMQPFDFDNYDARMASMDEQDIIDQKKINELCAPLDDDFLDEDLRQAFALSMMPQPEVNDVIPQEVLEKSIRTAQEEEKRRLEQAQRELKAVHEEKAVVQDPPVIVSQSLGEWEPSSGDVVRAGYLLKELWQGNNGVPLTNEEMINCLVATMSVSSAQARKILEAMDLID
jgi:hypothetical protein